ncbi:hypothetical protein K440DRAFT_645559 [Wilcoxina mikolae CBS 423.85]|nr:hypothetical protein K440DRAFT_645559 [Wilcoxina mikolae CBS 423.85]
MTSLLSIPNEVLLHIFSYLDPLHLAPLSLANRRLNLLTTPRLYSQYIADSNVICRLPIATKLPLRHASFVIHLEAWGQHSFGNAAFHRCPNVSTISWDVGPDFIDSNYFSPARCSSEFLHTITSLRIGLNIVTAGVNPFRWFRDAFWNCKNLRTLHLRPTNNLEFVHQGRIITCTHELLNLIDKMFGATLQHLIFDWCPYYRENERDFLLDSTLNSTNGFSALQSLQLPFSSNLSKARLLRDLHTLPTRKILYHAHLVSRLRPTLTFKNLQLPNDQPCEFTPLIVDLMSLSSCEILEFYEWLLHMFPSWNRQFLFPEVYSSSYNPTDIYAVVQTLAGLNIPFGLRHYVHHRREHSPWGPSFSHALAEVDPHIVALEMTPRPEASEWRRALLNRCDMDVMMEWVSEHLRFKKLEELEIAAPGLQGLAESVNGDTWFSGGALAGMVAEQVGRLGVKRLKICLPVGGMAGLEKCVGLVALHVSGVLVEEDEELGRMLGVLGERGLREFGLSGCVLMEGHPAGVEEEKRRERGIRDLVFEKLGEHAKIKLELKFVRWERVALSKSSASRRWMWATC